jgi:hypothetical protein
MAYFNPFTRLPEMVTTSTLEPSETGAFVSKTYDTHTYRCEGTVLGTGTRCMLVWDRARLAKDCALHNHRNQWLEWYYGQYSPGDGLEPVIWEQSYLRRALRRDGPKPGVQTQTPVQTPVTETPVLTLADLRTQALSLGYRLSKIPVKASATENTDEPAF